MHLLQNVYYIPYATVSDIRYFDDLQINVNSVRQIHLTFLIHKSHKLSIKNVNKRVEH